MTIFSLFFWREWLNRVRIWCSYYDDECDSCQHFAIEHSLRFLQLVQLFCLILAVEVRSLKKKNLCCCKANCANILSALDHGIVWKVQSSWEKTSEQQLVCVWFMHHETPFNYFRPFVPMILKWMYCLSQSEDRGTYMLSKMLVWRSELAPFPTWV